jgi:hypothetical protein
MALRDLFLAPTDDAPPPPRTAASTRSLAVLAPARDLPAIAAGAALALAGRAPTVLVCLHATTTEPPPPLIPPRAAATRLARSLTTRGFSAYARGRLVLARAPATSPAAATHALAAAASLPAVLGVGVRDAEVDALLAAQEAILVALPPSADPALAELALAGATLLAPAGATMVGLDPVSRALALAGIRAPGSIVAAVRELLS